MIHDLVVEQGAIRLEKTRGSLVFEILPFHQLLLFFEVLVVLEKGRTRILLLLCETVEVICPGRRLTNLVTCHHIRNVVCTRDNLLEDGGSMAISPGNRRLCN